MSLIGIVKAFSSLVSVAQPHVSKLIDYQKALSVAEEENKRLIEENKSLKTLFLTSGICAIVFFVSSVVLLVLFLSK
ncbi:MAG: hypothetical protein FWD54_00905 [Endomicrobia bacterium]|nr:hypothetical protein [Endomicrobiia bacterium]